MSPLISVPLHEQASVMIFQHLIEENGLMADLELYGPNSTDVWWAHRLCLHRDQLC